MTNYTFGTALTSLNLGLKCQRASKLKDNPNSYYIIEDNELYLLYPAHLENTYNRVEVGSLSKDDLLADDWVIIKD